MRWPPSYPIHYCRSLLRKITQQNSIKTGQITHAIITTTGLATIPNTFLHNTLLHMYASFNSIYHAHKLFDKIPDSCKDTVDWTALMGCLNRCRLPERTLILFLQMLKHGINLRPDDLTMACFFNACAQLGNVWFCEQGFCCMVKIGLNNSLKACNALMDVYVKCGLVCEAKRIFEEMDEKSVVSWTVVLDGIVKCESAKKGRVLFDQMVERNEIAWTIMIVGYVESGLGYEAFKLLGEMVFDSGFELNHITLCSLLSASTRLGDLMMGKWVHVYALKTMKKAVNTMVGTSLVDMYAKCGKISYAIRVFEKMPLRNVVTWNSMLSGLAMHGHGKDVLNMFIQMVKEAEPDELTFTSILSACSHSGLVDQGCDYFNNLESKYGIKPKMEHYACMVDMLGRAGQLKEAERLINTMPFFPNNVVLGSLLGSCSVHGKLQLGETTLKNLLQMDPNNSEHHILLSNMYALAGKHDKANSLRHFLKKNGIKKIPGMSSINVFGQVHQFSAGDKSHPRTNEIYSKLDEMIRRLRLAGYVPNTASQVFYGGGENGEDYGEEQEEKELALFSHSEKLAVCFGLISTSKGATLRIFKNLRICNDCHSAIKIVSMIYDREIVVRDRTRFHCFKHGSCSCSDYW